MNRARTNNDQETPQRVGVFDYKGYVSASVYDCFSGFGGLIVIRRELEGNLTECILEGFHVEGGREA